MYDDVIGIDGLIGAELCKIEIFTRRILAVSMTPSMATEVVVASSMFARQYQRLREHDNFYADMTALAKAAAIVRFCTK